MTAVDDSAERDPLDLLSEQFLQRRRAGEDVTVDAFVAAHPAHATALRDLLPTLLALEQAKRDRASSGSNQRRASVPRLERLGDFRIVGEIGRGGMGVVFEAVQEALSRRVALKVLPQSALLSGNQLERFQREAQIAARLHHSNIVPVFGSGESDGYHWYAMQFIAGQSLDQWRVAEQQPLPRGSGAWTNRGRFIARIGVQAANALHYAHGLGTLHRDIKPANLLLENVDHLWVTDFGLAKALEADGITHTGDLLGTLQYMAPEQFAGQYDVRSEVYALGVTLYELLTLQPAFRGSSRSELMERIRTQRPESLRRVCPDIAEDLIVVIEKAMARDPADRYRTAEALQRDLQAFLEDRPIEARRLSPAALAMRWCRRNRALAALAVSTAVAVVGAGITGWVAEGITHEALQKERQSASHAATESMRANMNLRLALDSLGQTFDALVGRDPLIAVEDSDSDTDPSAVMGPLAVDPAAVEHLNRLLRFYDQFAAQNANDQALRLETARAHRRVGAIHVRLGTAEHLEQARRAFAQALEGARGCGAAGVRETAAVLIDLGRLEQRRGFRPEAARHLREALSLLMQEPDSLAIRFDRGVAHLQLAMLIEREPGGSRGGGGPPGGAPSGPGGSPGSGRDMARRIEEAHQHLQQALALVDGLLASEPGNREFVTLHARALLLASNLPGLRDGPRRPDRERTQEQEAQRQQALQLLADLVSKHANAEDLRLELTNALLADRRRDGGPRSRRGDPAGREVAPPTATEMEQMRAAKVHAAWLVSARPASQEYRELLVRASLHLGRALRDQASAAVGTARDDRRREAIDETQVAVATAAAMVAADVVGQGRYARLEIDGRRLLASLLLDSARRGEAIAQIGAQVSLLETLVASVAKAPTERSRALGFVRGDVEEFHRLELLLQRMDQFDLLARLRKVRAAAAASSTEPPADPPPDRPRGGCFAQVGRVMGEASRACRLAWCRLDFHTGCFPRSCA